MYVCVWFFFNGRISRHTGRRMDVPTAGKPESGGKYEEAGNHRRRHHRRGRRRTTELTKVGRFAKRKRERKKRGASK